MKSICLILTFLLGINAISSAQDLEPISLTVEEAINLALKNNPDLKRVQLNEQLLEKQVKSARSAGLPQVTGNAGFTDNFTVAEQLLPGEIFGQTGQIPVKFGVRYALNAGLEANQMLYNKEYLSNLKKLDAASETYSLQSLATKEDLVYNVAQTYIQYQITNRQEEILKANLARIEQLIAIAQAQFENGIIKKLDVDQLRVNRTNLTTELLNIELGAQQQLNVLKWYLALDMAQPIVLTDLLEEENRYPLSSELMLGENINYRLLLKQKELALLDDDVIKAGYYPTLAAFASYSYAGQSDKISFKKDVYSGSTNGMWGMRLSVPIFDGLQKKFKLQENKIKQEQLKLDEQNLALSTRLQFENANSKLTQNDKLLQTQKENIALAQSVYDITKLSYREGVAPLTELLNAETSLKEAQTQYLSALLQFKLAELDHTKASGQLANLIQQLN